MPHKDPKAAVEYRQRRWSNQFIKADEQGLCLACFKASATNGRRCEACAAKHVSSAKKRAINLKQAHICVRCMAPARPNRNTCAPCGAEQSNINKIERERCWQLVFAHYGAACACCGERERAFLSIDHINNDGAQHRKMVRSGALVSWLVRNGFPKEFQILCMNCNFAKGRKDGDGLCPHERARRAMAAAA